MSKISESKAGLEILALSRRQTMGLIGGSLLSLGLGGQVRAEAKRGGILKVAMPKNPGSLDPLTGGQGIEQVFLYTMFDTLVAWDFETLTAKPLLATDWHYSDPKTLVMNLRQGVTFHDGTPFDSAAVKTHIDRACKDPASAVKGDLGSVHRYTPPVRSRSSFTSISRTRRSR